MVDELLIEEFEYIVIVEYVGDDVELEFFFDLVKLWFLFFERIMEILFCLFFLFLVKGKVVVFFFDVIGNGR